MARDTPPAVSPLPPWPVSYEDWDEMACRVPADPVEDFVGRGRDMYAEGDLNDRQLGRALNHAGLGGRWKP